MMALVAALAGALLVAGVLGVVAGLRLAPVRPPAPRRGGERGRPWSQRLAALPAGRRQLLIVGGVAGVVLALATGWVIAVVLVPAAVVGVPMLLSAPEEAQRTTRLEALEEWTRSLSGVLSVSVGLEQALIATVRSAPEPIRAEVTALAARLRARWSTEDAIRAFADDIDDTTGDLVAGYLILGARRRGTGLAAVLESLAESVAADVRIRREIQNDRDKPRGTARLVTLITIGVLAFLAMTGDYVRPYASPFGQLLLTALLGLYVATLVWMRKMAMGKPLPRFIGAAAKASAR